MMDSSHTPRNTRDPGSSVACTMVCAGTAMVTDTMPNPAYDEEAAQMAGADAEEYDVPEFLPVLRRVDTATGEVTTLRGRGGDLRAAPGCRSG